VRIEVVRSGLVEAEHIAAAVAVDLRGRVVFSTGEVDRAFFIRSAAKPFQGAVTGRLGPGWSPEELAVGCASHAGDPAQVGIAAQMLGKVGLDESALRCPPAWPSNRASMIRVVAAGHRLPRRIWHNCSGKHSAMLAACVTQGWSIENYLDPSHPLQRVIGDEIADVFGSEVLPVGVDGCGAPVFRTSVAGLAQGFRRLGVDERYDPVRTAMSRFPTLVSGVGHEDAEIAISLGGAAKGGAEACMGIALPGRGAVGLKVWDGSFRAVGPLAFAVLEAAGWIPHGTRDVLKLALQPPVLGGGANVGIVRPATWLDPV
jgi:L-asparaginase II